ncbi:MAG: hypothetical protein RSB99_02700 [Bacilli bacterium]
MKKRIIIYLLILFSVFMVKDVRAADPITYKYINDANSNQSFTITIPRDSSWCHIVFFHGVQCEPIASDGIDLTGDINWGLWDASPIFQPDIKKYTSASIKEGVVTFYKNGTEGNYKQTVVSDSYYDATGLQCDYWPQSKDKKGFRVTFTVQENEKYTFSLIDSLGKTVKTQTIKFSHGLANETLGDYRYFIQKNKGKCPNYATYDENIKKFYAGSVPLNDLNNGFVLNGKIDCTDTVLSIKADIGEKKEQILKKKEFLTSCYDENTKMITCDQAETSGNSDDVNNLIHQYSNKLNEIDLNLCSQFSTYYDDEYKELTNISSSASTAIANINNATNASDRTQYVTNDNLNGLNSLVDNDFVLPEDDNYDTCESLMGSDLVKFLNEKIFGSIKIIAPILLILFGTLDFGKAVLSGDKDALSKASKDFIKRAIAVVAIFFIPTIINIIFSLVDSINGSTCGIH